MKDDTEKKTQKIKKGSPFMKIGLLGTQQPMALRDLVTQLLGTRLQGTQSPRHAVARHCSVSL